jgi:hypothetical protein
MPEYDRNCFRLACVLQQGLLRLQTQDLAIALPRWEFEHCQELHRKLERARCRGFSLAAISLVNDLERSLLRMREQLTGLLSERGSRQGSAGLPTLRDLYAEIRGLLEEFDRVEFDEKSHLITVTTDAVELEDVYLGTFEIRLNVMKLGRPSPYEVVAADPSPAAGHGSITHPHVKDEQLCEGEGAIPIQRALATGRLADFFQIVTRILNTYNSGSAYVQLEDWSGCHCPDCGHTVSEDDFGSCRRCDSSVCYDCMSCCPGCENGTCDSCTDECAQCARQFCNRCLTECENCDDLFCESCLSDGKCQTCHDRNQSETESGTDGNTAVAADPTAAGETDITLQPAGLEQAPLSA